MTMMEKENVIPQAFTATSASSVLRQVHLIDGKKEQQALVKATSNAATGQEGLACGGIGTPVSASRVNGKPSVSTRTPLGALAASSAPVRTPLSSIRQPNQGRDLGSIATPSSGSRALRERFLQQKPSQTPTMAQQALTAAAAAATASRRNTWNGDVDIYAETVLSKAARSKEAAGVLVERVRRVKGDCTCAQAWWDLLSAEEEALLASDATGKSAQGLYKLYEWATKLVPRKGNKNNESYISLWLGYIKRQKNEEDVRDTFKTLRNMGIGETSQNLYQQWALFEVAAGNSEKAKGIVKKGVKAGAIEKSDLESFVSKLSLQEPRQPAQPVAAPAERRAGSALATSGVAPSHHHGVNADPLDSKLSLRHKLGHLSQGEKVAVAPLHQGSKREEDDSLSRTDPSVLSSKTFCSSIYSNSSTLHTTGTPFRGEHPTSSTLTTKALHTYTPTEASKIHSTNAKGPGKDSKYTEATATTGDSEDQATPGSMKGPKRLGLKRFAGPARRIKPGEEDPKPQQSAALNSLNSERRQAAPPASSTVTENYTDLSGKLSPIVEASYSTSSASRNSTRSTSSGPTEEVSRKDQGVERPAQAEKRVVSHASASSQPKAENISRRQPAGNNASVAPRKAEAKPAASTQQVRESSNSVTVQNVKYTVLECVGKGGSSKVYKVISPDHKIFALKRIKLDGREKEAAAGFMDEITLLNRFKGRHQIVQLVDSQIFRDSGIIYMVLEYGEVDLARLLQRREKVRSAEGQNKIDLNFIRLHWQQMLEAVHIIHEERIVHSDLKPANFLFVEGALKLIDFGIAKAIQNDTTHIARESQVGTLNYMSPEAILSGSNGNRSGKQTKVGRASDVWSLGCILYQMVYGRTPFSHLQFIQKLHAITDPNHQIEFPSIQNQSLLDVMKRCLDRNPKTRIGIPELLDHLFLNPSQETVAPPNLLTPEFLNSMLMQLSNGGQSSADISKLSQELCKQLAAGTVPDLKSLIPSAQAQPPQGGPPKAPPPPPPPPTSSALVPQNKMKMIMEDIKKKKQLRPQSQNPQGGEKPSQGSSLQHGSGIAEAAAARALARAKQRQEAVMALEKKEAFISNDLQDALQKQHAALKPVGTEKQNGNHDHEEESAPESLSGVFRHELNKKFQKAVNNNNDTITMTGDLTGSVTEDTMDMSWN
ncbi:dual specificity protein kinase [Chloropicon primus]|uniref:Dual specificity protein kinase n=3 Tax=Chloropicon primus TaxID=1764295 RepID=A0A5B8MWT0_9CHLO|nr:dual specificity protein kinase [Chloropicon primus]|eukprot:QDZ24034.1 dual specificity protein kinase [Chloropicon primus]